MGMCTDLMNLEDFGEAGRRSESEVGCVADADGGDADAIEGEAVEAEFEVTATPMGRGGASVDADADATAGEKSGWSGRRTKILLVRGTRLSTDFWRGLFKGGLIINKGEGVPLLIDTALCDKAMEQSIDEPLRDCTVKTAGQSRRMWAKEVSLRCAQRRGLIMNDAALQT